MINEYCYGYSFINPVTELEIFDIPLILDG